MPATGRAQAAVLASLRNQSLLRAELAFGAAWTAEWAFTVGIGVYAYDEAGAGGVGLVSLARFLPAALLAPVISAGADRRRREDVLVQISVVRAVATAAAAAVLALDGPPLAVYACAVVSTVAFTPYRAAHSALLPSLCRTPEELASSNVVRGALDSMSVVAGPLLAAAVLDASELEVLFALAAAVALGSAGLVARLRYDPPPRSAAPAASLAVAVREGFRASVADHDVLVLNLLCLVQTFLRGCLTVYTVVVAVALLDLGEPGAGLLQAAVGLGAVVGSFASALLVTSQSMARWFAISVALWGLPFCAIGAVPERWAALLALGIIGVANALLDVAFFTTVGRLLPDAVMARVHGVFESAVAGSVALGAVSAAALISWLGVRPSLVVLGALGPLTGAVGWRRCAAVDRKLRVRNHEIQVLREVPMLRSLPVPTIDRLAQRVERRLVPGGAVVVRQGAIGMRFFVVAGGSVDVFEGGRLLRTMVVGEGFGEIALLRDVRRTTDVRGGQPDGAELCLITREDFVAAVTGVPTASAEASAKVEAWLAADRW